MHINQALVEYREGLLIARATELARAGRLVEAQALIGRETVTAKPEVLDLLARIAAQLRQYDQAEEYWRTAKALDPDNPYYTTGLEALADERKKEKHRLKLLLGVSITTVIALSVLLVVNIVRGNREAAPRPKKPNTTQSSP